MVRLRPAALLAALAVVVSFNALAQVEGKFGQALRPDSNYAAAAPNPVYTVLPLTIECWAKLSTKSAYNIVAANEPKHSVTHWELYAEKGSGHLAAHLPGFAPNLVRADLNVVDGKWHYLALTCDGQTAKLYLDADGTPAHRDRPQHRHHAGTAEAEREEVGIVDADRVLFAANNSNC